jgi:uncharacterized protein YecE (DUF72 family)
MPHLYLGTSGFTYRDWRGAFYPKGVKREEYLAFYSKHYNAVEVNSTFYRPFPEHIYERWRDQTPPEFRFVLKAPRTITHDKGLIDVAADIREFVGSAAPLGEKLAAVLWQLPPSARAGDLRIPFARFVLDLPPSVKHIVEFRHASWFNDDMYDVLNEFNIGLVINDSPRFPQRDVVTGGLMYVRFHGPGKLYDSLYNDEQLQTWAARISPRLSSHDVYLFFNNTFAGQALGNANTLRDLLRA